MTKVIIYQGVVNEQTAERLIDIVYENLDSVVGFKLWIDDEPREGGPLSVYKDEQLNITWQQDDDVTMEVLFNGEVGRNIGHYTVDGFYLLKSLIRN